MRGQVCEEFGACHTFFRSWQRKVGCLALVGALVLATAWVRSLLHEDVVSINVFPQQIAIDSTRGRLHIFRYENFVVWTQRGLPPLSLFQWETFGALAPQPIVSDRILNAASWSLSSFGQDAVSPTVFKCVIPYWSVTIPLTSLSTWLLLSKPRQRPKPTT
ncbi:MAG: hypothetical protein JWP89_6636 [Schlesneria sp.]|nr:hypothetical protein [Schlesneria sp.]